MPAVRRLFKHARIETAVRQRKCHRKQNEHEILKGDICLVIRDPDGRDKNYCIECAMPILDRAQKDLNGLAACLGLSQLASAGLLRGDRFVRDSTAQE